ncbi:MAG: HTTM domain-containing protein [Fuerstiella sp.]
MSRDSSNSKLSNAMTAPVDAAFLAWFRFAFGIVMACYAVSNLMSGSVRMMYVNPTFHFKYFGFHWVPVLPQAGMFAFFIGLGILALMIALGLCYRFASIVFAVMFTWLFLMDRTYYQNHYYLVTLLSWMMVILPAGKIFALDVLGRSDKSIATVPAWMLWVVRFHIGLPYFMGGIAKLDGDWLLGQPMRMTLASRTWVPGIGPFMTEDWMVSLFSWGGMLFDLLVVPGLLWKRTRGLAFGAALAFHLTNAFMFTIGIFPWLMIAATLVFFPPGWPRRVLTGRRLKRPAPITDGSTRSAGLGDGQKSMLRVSTIAILLGVYVTFHFLWPLRYLATDQSPNWTERGHFFAWHMLLRGKKSGLRYFTVDRDTGDFEVVNLRRYLAIHQMPKLGRDPENIRQLANLIHADVLKDEGRDVEVRVFSLVSMNGRKPQLMIDPKVDLGCEASTLSIPSWIVPLKEPLRRDHWSFRISEWEQRLGIEVNDVMGFATITSSPMKARADAAGTVLNQ